MTILLPVLLLLIIVVCVAMLQSEGLWGNILNLINVLLGGLLAMNFWEPLADLAEQQLPEFKYFWDFLALWVIFCASVTIFRQISRIISPVKVRFRKPVEVAGKFALALVIGWVLVCFSLTTLHTAPLGREFLFGAFQPEQRMFFGLGPDRHWLGFVMGLSEGSLARGTEQQQIFAPANMNGEFIHKYGVRRKTLETERSFRVSGG